MNLSLLLFENVGARGDLFLGRFHRRRWSAGIINTFKVNTLVFKPGKRFVAISLERRIVDNKAKNCRLVILCHGLRGDKTVSIIAATGDFEERR